MSMSAECKDVQHGHCSAPALCDCYCHAEDEAATEDDELDSDLEDDEWEDDPDDDEDESWDDEEDDDDD